jgi:stage II sporulation protein D
MRKILQQVFSQILIPLTLLMIFMSPAEARPLEPTIRVGILSDQHQVVLSADTDFEIRNGETGQLLERVSTNQKAIISLQGKNIFINDKPVAAIKYSIVKIKNDSEHYITVNGSPYRGDIDFHLTHSSAGLTVVNTLPIEQYLYGVIAREISPEWPLEAVKAQTVAARTYAMYNMNKHQEDGYDVCSTTDCQVYGGVKSEDPRAMKAVDDTAGQVIMYQGKMIAAYFHSNSGGYTENSENVWSTYQPYLRGVVDYDQNSPYYKWEKRLTPSELTVAMNKAGYAIGTVSAIELAPLSNKHMVSAQRGISGRVKVVQVIGTNGRARLTGEKFRTMLGLKSTLFDLRVMVQMGQKLEFEIADSNGDMDNKQVDVNLPPSAEQGFITDKIEIHRIMGRPGEVIVVSGFGFGHGIGLSQWGAKAMAEQGPQGNTTYFQEILKHYYQGTTIKKVF